MTPSANPISQDTVDAAIKLLRALDPPILDLSWEYQGGFTEVLFLVRVPEQPEAAIERAYFEKVVPRLSALIPKGVGASKWMLIFQDPTGHTITSCCA